MSPSRPGVVFDCNVFLQAAARASGPAAEALRVVERGAVTLYVSRPILREVRRALEYPEVRQKNPQLTDEVIDAFLARVVFRAVQVRDVPRAFDFPRDPGDEPYIDLAIVAAADYLVTRDRDLHSLATDHSREAKEFRQRLPRTVVLDPVRFLDELRRTMPEAWRP